MVFETTVEGGIMLGTRREDGSDNEIPAPGNLDILRGIEGRILWLATSIVHHANRVRKNTSGVKVGGHQASSASMASIELSRLGKPGGTSSYLRLSTRPVDQSLANVPKNSRPRDLRRRQTLSGGYKLRDSAELGLAPSVALAATGAMMPEAIRAAELLGGEGGIGADVICLTSYDLLFRALRARQGLDEGEYSILETLFPEGRKLPIVSVIDGHPHALAFLGGIQTVPQTRLGVADFGQSGDVDDLYEHYGIDSETIIGAALDVIG